ncbi:MAG: ABC transporter permease [Candidatus Pacebacteria bacterium]|nr:ABC transporter permease [Candidatus Paceibacterota bacterium]
MDVFESIQNAGRMIVRNKIRSFLTMLGIIIGITAVIIVLSVGESVEGLILNEVKSIGSNLIGVLPGHADENGPPTSAFGVVITTLKYEDGDAIIKSNYPHIESLAMYVSGSDIISLSDKKVSATFYGTTASYPEVQNSTVERGRFFTKDEEMSNAKVVVLGSKVAEDLFGDQDPLGMKLKIKKTNFTVIGILKSKGGGLMQNEDTNLFVPIRTAQNVLLGINHLGFIRIKVDRPENIDGTMEYVKGFLRDRHNIDDPSEDDFSVRSTAQALETIGSITTALRFFLAAIAAISLIVGGFGIMNIMLATVQERTKEIGLRKAVGAKSGDIVRQFLIEAATITFISGVIGIIVGSLVLIMISAVVNALGYSWELIISPLSVFLGCLVSISIGLIFGIAPARKAALLDPIESLRYE